MEQVFLVVGLVGVAIVVVSLFLGDLLDGVLDFAHFDFGDGVASTPVLGAFLAAFGFGGWLLLEGETPPLLAGGGALVAGIVVGGLTLVMVRGLMNMPTDPTPRTSDLVGSLGTVVTRIPADGFGEVAIRAAGQRLKLNARADAPLSSGTTVVVVDVMSPTSVVVTESGFEA